ELKGIAQQVEQYLPQPHGVDGEGAEVLLRFDQQAVLVLLGELASRADHLLDQRRELHRLRVKLKLARLDLGEVEHLVDEAEQVSPSAVHALQRLLRLFCAEARRVFDHHLGQSDDGVERRAQLVAHAGDELRLVLARLLQLTVLVLDFVEQPHVLDGDHRLVSEGRKQLDLLVSEGRDLRLPQPYCAERYALAQQGYRQHRSNTHQFLRFGEIIFRVRLDVWNLDRTTLQQRAARRGPASCADRGTLPQR